MNLKIKSKQVDNRTSTMIKLILNSVLLGCITFSHIIMANQSVNSFLLRPSGKYGIAFKDLHWINNNICPDPRFSEKNKKDFSHDNKRHCHELMIRVYYPTALNSYAGSLYYRPTIEVEQTTLRSIPGIKPMDIDHFAQLKSHTIKNAPPVENKKFSVVIFSPGFGVQTQLYENIITDLVSHGFIIVGINSVFIDGDIELPNGHVVHTLAVQNRNEAATKTMRVLEQDISFVYNKIHIKTQDMVFNSMDLKHIGALGHSIGGKAIANIVNQHEDWFQALVTLDMASYKPNDSMMQFNIPYMHVISAYWKSYFNWPLQYHLGKNGYLVVLSPSEKDKHYSYHMNFSDFSTLQYLPVYQASMANDHSKLTAGKDVVIQIKMPEESQFNTLSKPCYVIVKHQNTWKVFYYEPGKKKNEVEIKMISGLQAALNNLPMKQLTSFDTAPIKNIIHAYHQQYGSYIGKGNGFKITKAIDTYLSNFFSHFLKNTTNIRLEKCIKLSDDTFIECGQS